MRRAVLTLVGTIAGLVLLLSFKTRPATPVIPAAADGGAGPTAGTSSTTGADGNPPTSTPGAPASGTRTITGSAGDTPFGPVKVQITVTNGKLTKVTVLQQPDGTGHDVRINSYALPLLNQEAVSAQSAHIQMISGATYTSEGYATSLQSALDQAGL